MRAILQPLYFAGRNEREVGEYEQQLNQLKKLTAQAAAMAAGKAQAEFYRDQVMEAMKALRAPLDKLEMIVDKEIWTLPSYGDLTFEV